MLPRARMPPPGAVYRGSASASVVAPALASPPPAGETRDGTDQAEDFTDTEDLQQAVNDLVLDETVPEVSWS